MKNGVNWGKLQSVTLTLELSLKMSYFPDYYEESFTLTSLRQIPLSTGKLVHSGISFLSASKKGH